MKADISTRWRRGRAGSCRPVLESSRWPRAIKQDVNRERYGHPYETFSAFAPLTGIAAISAVSLPSSLVVITWPMNVSSLPQAGPSLPRSVTLGAGAPLRIAADAVGQGLHTRLSVRSKE